MSIIGQIMELSRANTGFNGGTYVDTYQGYSIEECAQMATYEMQQSLIETAEISDKLNETVLGALMEAAKSGNAADTFDAINEAQNDSANKRAQAFEKVKAFINSIVAKLVDFINNLRNHTKFIQQNTNLFKSANFNDKKINGYPFPALMGQNEASVININNLNITNYEGLVTAAKLSDGVSDAATVQKNIDDWFIKQTGIKVNAEGNLRDNLKEVLFGAKEAAELPMNNFNRDSIIRVLSNAQTLRDVQSSYKKASNVINDMINQNKRSVAAGMKEAQKSGKGDADITNANGQTQDVNSAAKELTLAQSAFTEWSNLLSIVTSYARALWSQAWNIFRTGVGVANKASNNQQNAQTKQLSQNAQTINADASEAELTDEACGDKKKKTKNEEAVDDTDELKSAYDESSDDLSDDDFDFTI